MNRVEEYLTLYGKGTPESVTNVLKCMPECAAVDYTVNYGSGKHINEGREVVAELDIKTPDADFLITFKLKR